MEANAGKNEQFWVDNLHRLLNICVALLIVYGYARSWVWQQFPEYHHQLVQAFRGDPPSLVFRRWNHPVHVLTLLSSSSARLSATHGDFRLPNLKRRLPGEKKTA